MQGNRAAKQRESPASQENIDEERERKNIRKIRRRCRENATEGSGSPASQLDVTRFSDAGKPSCEAARIPCIPGKH